MGDPAGDRGFSWSTLLRSLGRALLALPRPLPWILAGGWMGLIWWISSRKIDLGLDPSNRVWPVVSNLAHAPLFGILTLLVAAIVLRPQRSAAWPSLSPGHHALILTPVALWAAADEWHQSWVVGRHSTWTDVLMDLVGAVLVLWIVVYLGRDAARESGLRRRLWIGIVTCVVFAVLTSRDLR